MKEAFEPSKVHLQNMFQMISYLSVRMTRMPRLSLLLLRHQWLIYLSLSFSWQRHVNSWRTLQENVALLFTMLVSCFFTELFTSLFRSLSLPLITGVFKRTVNCPVTANTTRLDETVKNARHSTLTNPGEEQLLRILMNAKVSYFLMHVRLFGHITVLHKMWEQSVKCIQCLHLRLSTSEKDNVMSVGSLLVSWVSKTAWSCPVKYSVLNLLQYPRIPLSMRKSLVFLLIF